MSQDFQVSLRNVRIAARKARLVVDLVRGRPVQDALDILRTTQKKASPMVAKLIHSAIANATNQATIDADLLYVSEAYVGDGPMMKRFLPRAQGRASAIRKRSSHIVVKLAEY